jgi:hypothetical protein
MQKSPRMESLGLVGKRSVTLQDTVVDGRVELDQDGHPHLRHVSARDPPASMGCHQARQAWQGDSYSLTTEGRYD